MIGRFLLGAGLGALVGTGLLAMASIFSPPPRASAKPATTAESKAQPADAVSGETGKGEAEPAVAPEPSPVPEVEVEPQQAPLPEAQPVEEGKAPATESNPPATAAAPQEDPGPKAPEIALAPETVTAPETLPAIAGDQGPVAPPTPAAAPDVAGTVAPEDLPNPTLTDPVPAAPAAAEAPAVVASPDLPAAPVAEAAPAETAPPEPPPLSPEEEAMLADLAKSGSAVVPEADALPASPADGDAPAAIVETDPVPEAAPAAEEPLLAEEPPVTIVEVDPSPDVPSDGMTEAPAEETPTGDGDRGEAQLAADPSLPSAAALPEAPEGVTIGRLPRIGDEPTAEATEASSDLPLIKYARPFENPEAKPAFAIVLMDDGDAALDRAALAALPFPVTFALDPNHPAAAEHAAIYRSAGLEVVMIVTGLPQGAAASDVEVAMAAMAQSLAESVAVMDMPELAFQGNRPLSSLVVPVIGGQGRGILTWDEGLNAADQVARREEVPSAVVFRDLDAEGETPQVIRRYLDRAAFKAAQDGKVTVVGRARPETVAAILEWTVEGRAATVALAPLSAVLSVD